MDLWEGSKLLKLNTEIVFDISVFNLGGVSAKYKLLPGLPNTRYEFTFNPKEGSIKKVTRIFYRNINVARKQHKV
jgi:hypothetical protein